MNNADFGTPQARPEPWENPDPSRFHFEVAPSPDWRLVDQQEGSKRRCRWTVGPGHLTCKKPSVAALNRRHRTISQRFGAAWWHYCGDHLYANWIEDGQVLHWRLTEGPDPAADQGSQFDRIEDK